MPDDPRALLAAGPPTLGLHFKTIWKYFTCSFQLCMGIVRQVLTSILTDLVEILFYFSYIGTASEDGKNVHFVSNTSTFMLLFSLVGIKTKTN